MTNVKNDVSLHQQKDAIKQRKYTVVSKADRDLAIARIIRIRENYPNLSVSNAIKELIKQFPEVYSKAQFEYLRRLYGRYLDKQKLPKEVSKVMNNPDQWIPANFILSTALKEDAISKPSIKKEVVKKKNFFRKLIDKLFNRF